MSENTFTTCIINITNKIRTKSLFQKILCGIKSLICYLCVTQSSDNNSSELSIYQGQKDMYRLSNTIL